MECHAVRYFPSDFFILKNTGFFWGGFFKATGRDDVRWLFFVLFFVFFQFKLHY